MLGQKFLRLKTAQLTGVPQEFPPQKGILVEVAGPTLIIPPACTLLRVPAPAQTRPCPQKVPRPAHGAWRVRRKLPNFSCGPQGQVEHGPHSKEQQISGRNCQPCRSPLGHGLVWSLTHIHTHTSTSLLHRGPGPSWHRPWGGARQGREATWQWSPGHATFPEGVPEL